MQPACLDLRVIQGATTRKPMLLMQPEYTYRDIAGISSQAPLRLSVPDHGLPGDWPTWVERVIGWAELNRDKLTRPPRVARLVDPDTIEFNDMSADGETIRGGRLVYQLPIDLEGSSVALTIIPELGPRLSFTSENGGLKFDGPGRLLLEISVAQTAAMTWDEGRYEFDITWSDGSVDRYLEGPVTVSRGRPHG